MPMPTGMTATMISPGSKLLPEMASAAIVVARPRLAVAAPIAGRRSSMRAPARGPSSEAATKAAGEGG